MGLLLLVPATRCNAKPQSQGTPVNPARLMTPQDLQALPSRAPDRRVSYGEDSSQYGELRVPIGPGPHPVAILIHGGCFKAAYASARDLAPMGDALKADGIATWNVDHLRTLAGQHALDLNRVVIVGHSAGGHLAMWAAARARLPRESPISVAAPLRVRGVIDLAGPVDMTANISGYERLCGQTVVTTLLGGTPATMPDRYAQVSAIKLLPLGMPQVLVIGEHEDFVPRQFAEAYVHAATQAGDPAPDCHPARWPFRNCQPARVTVAADPVGNPGVTRWEVASQRHGARSSQPPISTVIATAGRGNLDRGPIHAFAYCQACFTGPPFHTRISSETFQRNI